MIDIALKYHAFGLSVIPVNQTKIPIGSWKANTQTLIMPNGNFHNAYGIGIVAGEVSGGLEVLDIDEKYSLDKKLFENYKELINNSDENLLAKLVIQKTQNKGYHLIYKCSEIEGNKKLASRNCNNEEQLINPKEKIKVLIETRGTGGYIMVAPSIGYEIIQGSLGQINTITPTERNILFDCAKALNEVFSPVYEKPETKKIIEQNTSPFEDFNSRGEVLNLLQEEGWKITAIRGSKNLLLRPGGEGKWSADWDEEKRLFYVWTSSSDFENSRAYNSVQVLAHLKFNKDYSATAKWLRANGYGLEQKTDFKKPQEPKPETKIEDFISDDTDTAEYLHQVRTGTFKMGLLTGFPDLDNHFRFKPASFVIVNGHDNVGKSVVMWYFGMLSAKLHGWKWIIYSSENKAGGVKRKLIEFYFCKHIEKISDSEFKEALDFINNHFTIIKNTELYTYVEILKIGKQILDKKHHDCFLIDPYNSLYKDTKGGSEHEYDYKATGEFRLFIQKNKCSIYLNCHAITEALRRKYPKGHKLEGYPMPPDKADTEGGGKFSNKADDFLVIHRLVQHDDKWMDTEIHVKKIKEMETGGKHTGLDSPIILRMVRGLVGFENANGINPIRQTKEIKQEIKQEIKPTNFYETEPNNDDAFF